jgi:hypothetical protein
MAMRTSTSLCISGDMLGPLWLRPGRFFPQTRALFTDA